MTNESALATAPPLAQPRPLSKGAILIVDDEPLLLRAFGRLLTRGGYEVEGVCDGKTALAKLATRHYDAVFVDVTLSGECGLDVLRQLRERDANLPIVLMTGSPSLATAIDAVEAGALRYLVKPIDSSALASAAAEAVRRRREADHNTRALSDSSPVDADHDLFERACESLYMVYQPIVCYSERRALAYEALLRTSGPGMPQAGALVDLAQRCDRVSELGQRIRAEVAKQVAAAAPAEMFINLHPSDLLDDDLYDAKAPLSRHAPRVVLEVTERAGLDEIPELPLRLSRLRALGYRIAVDDLGEGYSGLTSLARLEPEFVKLDMSLVRNIDKSAAARHIVRSTLLLCQKLGSRVIAEGVETAGERDVLVEIGCDLLQGYLFARPSPPFVVPTFA